MDADFSAQGAVGVIAAHFDGRALDAGHLAGRVLEHFGGEAAPVAELEVHALKHRRPVLRFGAARARLDVDEAIVRIDRKSTRLNSSHSQISYAVFCLKKKKNNDTKITYALIQP